jgi:hypothetical protein
MAGEILLLEYSDIVGDSFLKGDGRIYAMVFDPITNKALKFSGAVPYTLQAFNGDQSAFARILPPTPNRSKHYGEIISCTAITLPDVGLGNYYTIEYWSEAASGVMDREDDYYLGTDRLTWLENRKAESRLDLSQEIDLAERCSVHVWDYLKSLAITPNSMGELIGGFPSIFAGLLLQQLIKSSASPALTATFQDMLLDIWENVARLPTNPAEARFEAFCSTVYDTELARISFMCWLEKDGALQLTTTRAEVKMRDVAGNVIAHLSSIAMGADGQFTFHADGIPLSPDEVYFVRATLKDADGIEHNSGSSPVSWD